MSYHSREDLRRRYEITDDELLSKNKQKRKQTPEEKKQFEEDWEKYRKKYVKNTRNQEPKGWERDDD